MRLTFTLIASIAITACLADSIPNSASNPRGGNNNSEGRNPTEQTPSEELPSPQGRICYICGVQNSIKGETSLVLFKDGERQLSLLCCDDNFISAEPDTHFLFEGNLYTTWHGQGKTVICKNGRILYSWAQEEYIKDLIVCDEDLWALCLPIGKEGFNLRKNSTIAYSKSTGLPGDLYIDNGSVCFRYSERTTGRKCLHLVQNASDVLAPDLDGAQHDLRIINSQIWSLTCEEGEVLLKSGRNEKWYTPHAGFTPVGGSIETTPDGEPFADIHLQSNYSPMMADQIYLADTVILSGSGSRNILLTGQYPMRKITLDKNMEHLYIGSCTKGDNEYILRDMRFADKRCAVQENGKLYLALTPKDPKENCCIWTEGNTYTLNLKGTVSGISFSQPK